MNARPLACVAWLAAGLAAPSLAASTLPDAVALLHVQEPGPGRAPAAAPLRFALTKERRVFVGGSRHVLSASLEKDDVKLLEKAIDRVRKLKDLPAEVRLGPGDDRYELDLFKGDRLHVVALGDPAFASGSLRPLGELLTQMRAFSHLSLRRMAPTQFLLTTREGTLPGGCREWALPVTLAESLPGPLVVPAARVHDWPAGAYPASVCAGDRRYVVTLRPLLPGERP